MKKLFWLMFVFLFVFSSICFAAGTRRHPNRHRYGYVPLPLSSFYNAATNDHKSVLKETSRLRETNYEGTVSIAEAVIGMRQGKQAIMIGKTDKFISTSFKIPDNYWREGKIFALVENTAAVNGPTIDWNLHVSTASALDSTPSVETELNVQTVASGTIELLEFEPASEGESTFAENAIVTFNMRKFGLPRTGYTYEKGNLNFYDFVFRYEKKVDN